MRRGRAAETSIATVAAGGGTLAGSTGAKGSESISLKSLTACVVGDTGNANSCQFLPNLQEFERTVKGGDKLYPSFFAYNLKNI